MLEKTRIANFFIQKFAQFIFLLYFCGGIKKYYNIYNHLILAIRDTIIFVIYV